MLPQEELKSVELCPSVAISAVVFRSSALQVPAAASSAGEINPTVEGDGQGSSSQSTVFRKLPFPYGLVYWVETHHHTTGGQQETGLFIQVPLSTGATLQAGLDSDHRAKDNSMVGVGVGVGGEGVLLHHTEEQGLGEKKPNKPG